MAADLCPQCGSPRQPGTRFCGTCAFDYWKAAEGQAQAALSGPSSAPMWPPQEANPPSGRRNWGRIALIALGVVIVLAVIGTLAGAPGTEGESPQAAASATERPTPTPEPSPTFGPLSAVQEALVVEVVDGDTIKVDLDGTVYTVRYIGIDTPETVDPGSPVEWMGPAATAGNTELVDGEMVYLERDVSETDRFGRLLRYVWLEAPVGWLLVNRELVRLGFAAAVTYPPDVRYQDLFLEAQRQASTANRGLWGPTPTPAPTAAPTPIPLVPPPPAGNCDPSYPGVCIPPYPPDLDCGDVPYRRFQVVPPDPHGFDGDHDGIGCES